MTGGFTPSAIVCATTYEAVLNAVVRKLQFDITELSSESTCFVSDASYPGVEVNESLFCTVTPMDGPFEFQPPVGAGDRGIVETAVIQITVWSRLLLDRLDHSSQALTDVSRGLLKFKQRVLKSLAGSQLYADLPSNTQPLLLEALHPTRALHPSSRRTDDDFRSCSLIFQGSFAWDITAD